MLSQLLLEIDFFSVSPALLYKRNSQIHSFSGGLFSIMSIILILLSIVYFSKDLYKRTNPTILRDSIIESDFALFNISKETIDFNFSVAIQNPPIFTFSHLRKNENESKVFDYNNSYVTENNSLVSPYIEIYAQQYIIDRITHKTKKINLKISNCSEALNLGRKDYLCIDFNNSIIGNGSIYDKNPDYYINIHIDLCKNTTYYNKCKSADEIKYWIMKTGYINVYRIDTSLMIEKLYNPIKSFFKYDMVPFNWNNVYERYYSYDVALLESDEGLVFASKKLIEFLKFSNFEEIYMTNDSSKDNNLIKIKFVTSNIKLIIKRKFVKIQEVFANLGGIYKSIILIFRILSTIFVEKSFYLTLSNDIWNELNPIKEENNFKNKLKGKNPDLTNKSLELSIDINKIKENKYIEKKELMNYSKKDFIRSVICFERCKKPHLKNLDKIYELSKNRIAKRLDVVEFIKYLIEIDRLKYVLFDESQLNCLNYLRDKKIEFNTEYIKDEINIHNNSYLENYNKLSNSNRTIKKNTKKILSLMD